MKPLIKMKATELRIGNLFNGNYPSDDFVMEITPDDIVQLYDDPQDDYYQAIPLTEEWLFKFGFEEYGGSFYKESLGGFIQNECNGWIYEVGDNQICFFNHVHQLQNLYFALTQEELKIK